MEDEHSLIVHPDKPFDLSDLERLGVKCVKLGAIMRACRERAGLTQEKLAEKLHRSPSCISKIEKDHKVPDVPTFLKWIQVTGAQEVMVAFLCGMDGINIMQQILGILFAYHLIG